MRGFAGEDGKDANLCLQCGGPKPKSLGAKPRKFCSARCLRESVRPAKPWPSLCESCGKDTGQKPGRGRRRRLCDWCKRLRKESSSKSRRPPAVHNRKCPTCTATFDVTSRSDRKKFCSVECGRRSSAVTDMLRLRGAAKRKKYTCLCCGIEFSRRRHPSGGVSCQKKYCSRDCAFEARRRRLPAAIDNRRSGGLTDMLAKWFLSWGDDVYPIITKCQECGSILKQANGSAKPPCPGCARRKRCGRCDCVIPSGSGNYSRHCDECAPVIKAEQSERRADQRRAEKKKYGRSHRQRCRYHGVPYTPIQVESIYERDEWRCQVCDCELKREWDIKDIAKCRTIDHIIPLSAGPGSPGHVLSNVRACCWECNTAKGDSFAHESPGTLH